MSCQTVCSPQRSCIRKTDGRGETMISYCIVRMEHLNHYGFLFGGRMLQWVDEFAWLAATRDYPGCTFVTRAMDRVEFTHQVPNGSILLFDCSLKTRHVTSVVYSVSVQAQYPSTGEKHNVFSTNVVFVNVDPDGRKVSIPVPDA